MDRARVLDAHKCIVSMSGGSVLAVLAALAALLKNALENAYFQGGQVAALDPRWPPSDAHFWPILSTGKLARRTADRITRNVDRDRGRG